MKGYTESETHVVKHLWREIEPTAASLIEALSLLPPDTRIEVGVDSGPVEPSTVLYYPKVKEAWIS